MNKIRLLAVIWLSGMISACQTTSDQIGSGDIVLAPWVAEGFDRYKNERQPAAFAVSKNGMLFDYVYCGSGSCGGDAKSKAISLCNKQTSKNDCRLYAVGTEVVWQGTPVITESASSAPGKGPLVLSISSSAGLREYMDHPSPLAFAASEDGTMYNFVTCNNECLHDASQYVVESCNMQSLTGSKCRLLAKNKQLVWRGEITELSSASSVPLQVELAGDTTPTGPQLAKGVILYFPGWDPKSPIPADENIVQPTFVTLNQQGYDVFRVNIPPKYHFSEHDRKISEAIRELSQDFRQKGYKSLILAGQSAGAWSITQAANYESRFADALVLFAPATFGTKKTNGDVFKKNATEFYPLLEGVSQTKLMLFLFADDEFEPENRAEKSKLALQKIPHKVVAYPKGFSGHGSSWLTGFDFVFTDCIQDFIETSTVTDQFQCAKPILSKNDHRWMTQESHLADTQAKILSKTELTGLIGNTIIGRAFDTQLIMYLNAPQSLRLRRQSGYSRGKLTKINWRISSDSQACFTGLSPKEPETEECFTLYRWDKSLLMAVSKDGNIIFRGTVNRGDDRNLMNQSL